MNDVELIEANPYYALAWNSDGKESNVSFRDLASIGDVATPNIVHEERSASHVSMSTCEDHCAIFIYRLGSAYHLGKTNLRMFRVIQI